MTQDASMNDSIADLTARIRDFVARRDWQPYHNPKDMVIALTAEAGELLQHVVWQQPEQMDARVQQHREEMAKEMADIGILLFELADNLGVSLGDAMAAKLQHNEERYPVEKAKGNNRKYDEL